VVNSLGESLLELGALDAAADAFERALAAVVAATSADDASAASIQANQARLFSFRGDIEAARDLFESCLSLVEHKVDDADNGGDFMLHVIHSRVLKLFGEFEQAHGDASRGAERLQQVKRLEAQYGFLQA